MERSIFNNLTRDEKKSLKTVEFLAGQIIASEGEHCFQVGYLISGELKISTFTFSEKEETITIIKPGQLFGEVLIFTSSNKYLGTIYATKKSSVIFVKKEIFLSFLKSNELFLKNYLECLCDQQLLNKMHNKMLQHKNINDRIMYYLYIHKDEENNIYIKSVQNFADELSLPRPSVSRALSSLIAKKIIYKEKHFIKIL